MVARHKIDISVAYNEVVAGINGNISTSFLRPGSPSLPDKAKHNREVMILLPSHRERGNNSMYYNMAENGQVGQIYSAIRVYQCAKYTRFLNVFIILKISGCF